jgi:hypothetical protein
MYHPAHDFLAMHLDLESTGRRLQLCIFQGATAMELSFCASFIKKPLGFASHGDVGLLHIEF